MTKSQWKKQFQVAKGTVNYNYNYNYNYSYTQDPGGNTDRGGRGGWSILGNKKGNKQETQLALKMKCLSSKISKNAK